jgi:hypothetical protein
MIRAPMTSYRRRRVHLVDASGTTTVCGRVVDSTVRTTTRFGDVAPGWRCPKCIKALADHRLSDGRHPLNEKGKT